MDQVSVVWGFISIRPLAAYEERKATRLRPRGSLNKILKVSERARPTNNVIQGQGSGTRRSVRIKILQLAW